MCIWILISTCIAVENRELEKPKKVYRQLQSKLLITCVNCVIKVLELVNLGYAWKNKNRK